MDLTRTSAAASRLLVLPECGSTNAELRGRAADVVAWPHLSALLTDTQTSGRGRLDRTWTTPAGAALAVSVLLRDLPADVLQVRSNLPRPDVCVSVSSTDRCGQDISSAARPRSSALVEAHCGSTSRRAAIRSARGSRISPRPPSRRR
jgi:hypothetical protein